MAKGSYTLCWDELTDAQREKHCRDIDKLRELLLEEPYDSPIWTSIERIFIGDRDTGE